MKRQDWSEYVEPLVVTLFMLSMLRFLIWGGR